MILVKLILVESFNSLPDLRQNFLQALALLAQESISAVNFFLQIVFVNQFLTMRIFTPFQPKIWCYVSSEKPSMKKAVFLDFQSQTGQQKLQLRNGSLVQG